MTGPACAGKSTLIDNLCDSLPTLCQGLFIGRVLRQRHPPEYFQGSMALPSTEPEVYEIFEEGFQKFLKSTYGVLLCDGIPRLPSQVHFLTERLTHEGIKPCVVKLDVSEEEQLRRATVRGGTEAEKELTASRLQKDRPMLEDVYNEIESVGGWRQTTINADGDRDELLELMYYEVSKVMRPKLEELARLVAV